MKVIERNLEDTIEADLTKKFVFLSGPRQVGKTTLAQRIIRKKKGQYLLYDDSDDRRQILNKDYVGSQWVCLDEFHKFQRWKSQIKGVFDKYHENLHLLLTGSARLDIFQKSGDSLFGRYYLHHLHPLTCGELHTNYLPKLLRNPQEIQSPACHLKTLLKFGGFPEPFYNQSEKEHRRWSNMRRQLLVREELREITQIELIELVEQLMLLLPQRIGSVFSYHSLSEDIQVSVPTIQNWMNVLGRLFIIFKLSPYSKRIIRSIQKQPKYYLYDWSQITDEGSRFENFIASHLWKAVQLWTDVGEANLGLYYIKDRNHKEVDFLLTKDEAPWFLIEVKLSDTQPALGLKYFCQRLGVPGIQIVLKEKILKKTGNILVISAERWLGNLP